MNVEDVKVIGAFPDPLADIPKPDARKVAENIYKGKGPSTPEEHFYEFMKVSFKAYYETKDGSVYEEFLDYITDRIIDFCYDHDMVKELVEVM